MTVQRNHTIIGSANPAWRPLSPISSSAATRTDRRTWCMGQAAGQIRLPSRQPIRLEHSLEGQNIVRQSHIDNSWLCIWAKRLRRHTDSCREGSRHSVPIFELTEAPVQGSRRPRFFAFVLCLSSVGSHHWASRNTTSRALYLSPKASICLVLR